VTVWFVLYTATGTALFAAFLVYRVRVFRRGRASLLWPQVEGTVVAGYVGWRDGSGGDLDGGSYSLSVAYEYVVDGVPYHSTRISVRQASGASLPDEELWRGIDAAKRWYHEGDKVTVYYDPDKPSYAVVKPGADAPDDLVLPLIFATFVWAMILGSGVQWFL